MENPLKVSLENIIPLTEARDHFSQIVTEVQKDKLYVLTKGGKPAVAIVDVKYLEHITGGEAKVEEVKQEIQKAPEKVGLPPMVEHNVTKTDYLAPKPYPAAPPPPKIMPPPPSPATPTSPTPPTPKPIPPSPTLPTPPAPSPKPANATYIETSINNEPPKPAAKPNPPTPQQPSDGSSIDVKVMPDSGDIDKDQKAAAASVDRTDPADKPGPAQFDGDNKDEEPDDMVID